MVKSGAADRSQGVPLQLIFEEWTSWAENCAYDPDPVLVDEIIPQEAGHPDRTSVHIQILARPVIQLEDYLLRRVS